LKFENYQLTIISSGNSNDYNVRVRHFNDENQICEKNRKISKKKQKKNTAFLDIDFTTFRLKIN